MKINWCKCILQSNCRLNLLKLKNEHFDNLTGVYVIWSGYDMINVVCVGKGIIRDELIKKKIDKKILMYGPDLFVTWAAVPEFSLDGVEAFLYKELNPIIYQNISGRDFTTVNLP
jgi:hypothetical protein